jgi:hypothetical protein
MLGGGETARIGWRRGHHGGLLIDRLRIGNLSWVLSLLVHGWDESRFEPNS